MSTRTYALLAIISLLNRRRRPAPPFMVEAT